ncbi:type II toxin-antitoxin system VapC family toxin [Rhizobium sp. LCM 4573]|uniref:type II toxin-antitoxin system VapC family toxin n=1 Tax=Rhizobium sp. LCM 4573 TaxID=1848291 RepID=UPI0008D91426|nr:type II toxin-antitoxin system VapC family toxin [Rhizobium sp. LCM 4573]OHV76282.1 hypothetical protein LCM4573_11615 [Rhizobium sp. LCM 4573]
MFLETSAIVEYFIIGPEYRRIADALASANTRFYVSPSVIFEATTVLAGKRQIEVREATALLEAFLAELKAEVLPATRETAMTAIDAFDRYGPASGKTELRRLLQLCRR